MQKLEKNDSPRPADTRSGQAIVELVVALVVILVLCAGLLQISSLGVIRSGLMTDARREAGSEAMQPLPTFSAPAYIQDCTPGDDGTPYSKDDSYTSGDTADFINRSVSYSHPLVLDQHVPGNMFYDLVNSLVPQDLFGLTYGRSRETVPLLPVVRELLYASDTIEVEGKAWMTWTEGVY